MELGSDYNLSLTDLNTVEDSIFSYLSEYKQCFFFDSGRGALRHIRRHLNNYSKILLPEFICESISNCFEKKMISYYRLNEDFSINIEDLTKKIKDGHVLILLMHYFGALQPKDILEKCRQLADRSDSIIIEDTTHSIFTEKQTIGDYVICSIRKWLPISGGGVLYYKHDPLKLDQLDYPKSTDNYRNYGMVLKDLFLKEGHDFKNIYREIFIESEGRIDKQKKICGISDFSRFICSCVSVNDLISTRRRNMKKLKTALERFGMKPAVDFDSSSVALAYPIRLKNRDDMRSYFIDNKIYCAVHWPFDGNMPEQRPFAKKNADELISLPIDQRYDEEHMQYLIDVISRYRGGLSF